MAEVRLAPGLGGLRGKVGNAVYWQTEDGRTFVREAPRANDPRTPAQSEQRANFQAAVALYKNLSPEEQRAWRDWADFVEASRGGRRRGRANSAFLALALTYMRLHPGQWPPSTPPASLFLGDHVAVTAAAAGQGVAFTSDRPNSPGVATLLLLQRLRSVGERPRAGHDRIAGVHTFVPGGLSVTMPARPGEYECSVRLAEVATGQTTGLVRVGRVRVG